MGSAASILDFAHMGSSLSVRSFARLGSGVFSHRGMQAELVIVCYRSGDFWQLVVVAQLLPIGIGSFRFGFFAAWQQFVCASFRPRWIWLFHLWQEQNG